MQPPDDLAVGALFENMRVQQIEHDAHFGQQPVVVGAALAGAGQHRLEAARFGREGAADVERAHHRCEPGQATVALQAGTDGYLCRICVEQVFRVAGPDIVEVGQGAGQVLAHLFLCQR